MHKNISMTLFVSHISNVFPGSLILSYSDLGRCGLWEDCFPVGNSTSTRLRGFTDATALCWTRRGKRSRAKSTLNLELSLKSLWNLHSNSHIHIKTTTTTMSCVNRTRNRQFSSSKYEISHQKLPNYTNVTNLFWFHNAVSNVKSKAIFLLMGRLRMLRRVGRACERSEQWAERVKYSRSAERVLIQRP